MCAGLCSVSDNGVMVFPSPSKGHVQVVVSDGDMPVPPPDLAFLAVSTFSPIGSLSSNGMRMCVCVDGMNLSTHSVGISTYQFIPYYANAVHLHMHTRILKPFENSEPTGLKVDVAIFSVSQQKASYIVLKM